MSELEKEERIWSTQDKTRYSRPSTAFVKSRPTGLCCATDDTRGGGIGSCSREAQSMWANAALNGSWTHSCPAQPTSQSLFSCFFLFLFLSFFLLCPASTVGHWLDWGCYMCKRLMTLGRWGPPCPPCFVRQIGTQPWSSAPT